jgi:hypothetical protein
MAKPLLGLLGAYVLGVFFSVCWPRWATFDFRSWERSVFKRSGWDEVVAEAQKWLSGMTPDEFNRIFRLTTAMTWPYWVPGQVVRSVLFRMRAARIRSFRNRRRGS